jgi:NADH:ubiquinone oxidoreductase subunit 6 (subunit J)
MTMSAVLFFIAAIGVLAGAIGVIALENPFYSVLALVEHLVALAALYLLLRAQFVAAAQVVVYAGAVMVLYVFVVSYVSGGGQVQPLGRPVGGAVKTGAWIFGGALAAELLIAVLGTGLSGIHHKGAAYVSGFGTPAQIGQLLLTKFLLPFELASFLLLIAAVGAVVLARRRGVAGDEGAPVFSALDLVRPLGTGTMAEAAGLLGGVGAPGEDVELELERGGAAQATGAGAAQATEEPAR